MRKTCQLCGKEFANMPPHAKYCTVCKKENARIRNRIKYLNKNKVSIKITKTIPVYPELRPEIGEICEAVKRNLPHAKSNMYIIKRGGKQVIVRESECEEVEKEK